MGDESAGNCSRWQPLTKMGTEVCFVDRTIRLEVGDEEWWLADGDDRRWRFDLHRDAL